MSVETKTKVVVNCFVCLACLIVCGCQEEQSYHINKQRYYVPLDSLIDAANNPGETDGLYHQEEIELYALVLHEALEYVHEHSTERMKNSISKGELVIGMNQKEVLACLHATNFRDGVPVPSKTFNSKYGTHETWIVGGKYSCGASPKYTLDFNYFILTDMHKPIDALATVSSEPKTPCRNNNKYYKDGYEAMGRMCYAGYMTVASFPLKD